MRLIRGMLIPVSPLDPRLPSSIQISRRSHLMVTPLPPLCSRHSLLYFVLMLKMLVSSGDLDYLSLEV